MRLFGSPVRLEVVVPLITDCWGRREGLEEERAKFCRKYAGYGALCDCGAPAPLTYPEVQLENSVIQDVPVAIVARARPRELYKCLVTVLRAAGGRRGRILVVRDGDNEEVTALLRLLQVRHVIHHSGQEGHIHFASSGTRISLHYRFALHHVFHQAFPPPPAPFCWRRTCYAWNDLGTLHVASRPDLLYRVETHAGYGWMMTKGFLEEVYDKWKAPDKNHDWDIWFRSTEVRAGRECVVPDVSRTFHGGVEGAHIKGVMTHAYFTAHPVTNASYVKLNVDSYLRGAHTHVVVDPKEEEEYILGKRTLENRAHYRVPYLEKLAPYLAVDGRRVDEWMSQDDKSNLPLHFISLSTSASPPTPPAPSPPPTINLFHLNPTHSHPPNPGSRHRKRETSRKPQTSRFQDQDQDGVFENLMPKPIVQLFDKEGLHKVVGWRGFYYHVHPRPRNATTPLELVKTWEIGKEIGWDLDESSSSSSIRSSSCSSLTCKWFSSWEFITLLLVLLIWLFTLTSLLCLARSSSGRHFLNQFSSFWARDKDEDNQVLAKGIGYFDGSPGMRRFVLIEDEDDDDEEEGGGDANSDTSSDKQEAVTDEDKTKIQKLPRRGNYILQDAAKGYAVEFGTYRLQEDIDKDMEEDKLAYVLENGAYILPSERVERNKWTDRDTIDYYRFVWGNTVGIDVEGMYGLITQGCRAEVRDRLDRIGRRYDIINDSNARGSEAWKVTEMDDEIREIERRVRSDDVMIRIERKRADTGIKIVRRGSEEIRIEGRERGQIEGNARKLSLDEIRQRRQEIRQHIENGGAENSEVETEELWRTDTQTRGREREESLILTINALADDHHQIIKENVKKTTSEGGTMLNPRRSLGGTRPRSNTSYITKRAASFPMDNYCPVHLLPRKLSLIVEEEAK
ncbi:hypothetical protein O3P69_019403 [Scylla paramamosain]|uniref:Uncharacterized protein n=1 Tax=Scylla paramamosain TaxID=85552 RepID=A0AAW0SXR1_SCYPA